MQKSSVELRETPESCTKCSPECSVIDQDLLDMPLLEGFGSILLTAHLEYLFQLLFLLQLETHRLLPVLRPVLCVLHKSTSQRFERLD